MSKSGQIHHHQQHRRLVVFLLFFFCVTKIRFFAGKRASVVLLLLPLFILYTISRRGLFRGVGHFRVCRVNHFGRNLIILKVTSICKRRCESRIGGPKVFFFRKLIRRARVIAAMQRREKRQPINNQTEKNGGSHKPIKTVV